MAASRPVVAATSNMVPEADSMSLLSDFLTRRICTSQQHRPNTQNPTICCRLHAKLNENAAALSSDPVASVHRLRHSCTCVPTCPSPPTDQTHPASPRPLAAAAHSARAAPVPHAAGAGLNGAAAGPVALRETGAAPRSARACARCSSGPCCPRRLVAPGWSRMHLPLPWRRAQAMPAGVWSPRRRRPAVTCGQRAQHAVP